MKEDKRNSQEWIHTQALKDTHSESIITPAGKGPARRHHAAVRAQVLGPGRSMGASGGEKDARICM
jgi:hypothetical protein